MRASLPVLIAALMLLAIVASSPKQAAAGPLELSGLVQAAVASQIPPRGAVEVIWNQNITTTGDSIAVFNDDGTIMDPQPASVISWACYNTSSTEVYLVDDSTDDVADGAGPFCTVSTCELGPVFGADTLTFPAARSVTSTANLRCRAVLP